MSLFELMCASAGLGVSLGLIEPLYESFGIIGVIVGVPIGFVIVFYLMAFIFVAIALMLGGIEKVINYWKSE